MLLKAQIIILDSIIKSVKLLSTVWNICCHQEELLKLHSDHSSLLGMWFFRKIFWNWDWKIFWKNGNSWITCRDLTKIPITVITWNFNFSLVKGLFINFSLIDAYYIGFWLCQIFLEIFFSHNRSNSVNVPTWNEQFIWGLSISIFPVSNIVFLLIIIYIWCVKLFRTRFNRLFLRCFYHLFWK